jgi:phenylacetate-CoA ligase
VIRKAFADNIGLQLVDKYSRLNVRSYYKLYKEALRWSRENVEAFQLARLKVLLRHAYNNVPFYRTVFKENGLTPDSFNSLKDIGRLPLLTRTNLHDNLQDLLSADFRRRKVSRHSSSGTTGTPIVYYKDTNSRSADIAAVYLTWHLTGCRVGDKRLHIWGTPDSEVQWSRWGSKLKRKLLNAKYFPAGSMDDESSYKNLIRLVNSYKPDFVDGYTSSIYSIARYAHDRDIEVHHPKVVLTTGDTLYSYQRKTIERVFGPVRDVYGCGEINGVAIQCLENNYHIIGPRVYVEYEDDVLEGGHKKIILTDLENHAMPFIRYEVGDLFDGIEREQRCTCGLDSTYFREIAGRTTELINLPNGMVISPVTVFGGAAFRRVGNFTKHQTIWNGKYLIFVFEVNDRFTQDDEKELESIISDLVQRYSVNYRLRTTKKIENLSPKFCYFKIDYDAA